MLPKYLSKHVQMWILRFQTKHILKVIDGNLSNTSGNVARDLQQWVKQLSQIITIKYSNPWSYCPSLTFLNESPRTLRKLPDTFKGLNKHQLACAIKTLEFQDFEHLDKSWLQLLRWGEESKFNIFSFLLSFIEPLIYRSLSLSHMWHKYLMIHRSNRENHKSTPKKWDIMICAAMLICFDP
jgi:hypothetical protein